MDKKQIAGIVVVIVSLLFITEQFYIGGGIYKNNGGGPPPGTNVSGTSVFNGSIRTYDPLLVIDLNTSQAVLDSLKKRDDVRGIRNDPKGYIIDTQTRDDVFPIATYLRSLNVTSYSVANVAITQDIPVQTASGMINATVQGGVIRVVTEPILDIDSPVTVSLIATVNDGNLVDYRSASIMLQNLQFQLDVNVSALEGKTYYYIIPWENRTELGNLSQYGVVDYKKVDTIVFQKPLNTSQILAKKLFSYVTYIDSGSAQVDPSFNNVTEIGINFQDTPYVLPSSKLTITTNQTLDLPYNGTVTYTYDLTPLNQSAYQLPQGNFFIQSDKALNGTISINVSAVGVGNRIISITHVDLPS